MADGTTLARADREQFSLHPEDDVTERMDHRRQVVYLGEALEEVLPGMFVACNLAVYWVPGQREHPYAGPDVLVSRHRPAGENPSVYLTYEDGPLTLVAEIASTKTRRREKRKRDQDYAGGLQVPEYLFIDLEKQILGLWELVEGKYEPIDPDSAGRLWSRQLGVGFAWQEDRRLVRVLRADGTIVPTRTELEARTQELAAEVERLRRALRGEG
jgi:Uma2 family endonuclease